MECSQIEKSIELYLDSELTLSDRRDFEEHVQLCSACESKVAGLRSIQSMVSNSNINSAPASLKHKIQNQLKDYTGESQEKFSIKHWFGFGAGSMAIGSFVTWFIMALLISTPEQIQLADLVVASHVRSMMVDHKMDVLSSDRHTVKPWFNGRVDFSPTVKDLQQEGYKLLGGRLDYIQGQSVSALVYQRRAHIINAFIFKSNDKNNSNSALMSLQRDGYNLFNWKKNGLEYWVISDLNKTELNEFSLLLLDP